jgi:hypothetical protein
MKWLRGLDINYFLFSTGLCKLAKTMTAFPEAQVLSPPAQMPVLLALLFADSGKDPTYGNWGTTMAEFSIDTHNHSLTVDTVELCWMMTAITIASDKPVGFVIVSGGVGCIYTSLMHWTNSLVQSDQDLHNKIFAL